MASLVHIPHQYNVLALGSRMLNVHQHVAQLQWQFLEQLPEKFIHEQKMEMLISPK